MNVTQRARQHHKTLVYQKCNKNVRKLAIGLHTSRAFKSVNSIEVAAFSSSPPCIEISKQFRNRVSLD